MYHDTGTFKVPNLPPTTPYLWVGGGGGETPKYVKHYFRLLQQHSAFVASQSFKSYGSGWREGG